MDLDVFMHAASSFCAVRPTSFVMRVACINLLYRYACPHAYKIYIPGSCRHVDSGARF